MEIQDLVEDLQAVGLGEDQATMYVRLLQVGPAKVGTLSQYFDSSRSKLYRLLDELAERGFVSKSLKRPTVYEAASPEEVFEIGINEINRSRQRLENVKEECLPSLETLASDRKGGSPDHHWQKIEGTAKIYKTVHELAENAQESFWAASNHEVSMSTYMPAIEQAWRIAFRRGRDERLDVRLLFDFENGKTEQLPEWIDPSDAVSMRSFQARNTLHFALADEQELLMWVRPAQPGTMAKRNDIAVHTNAPGSVFAHQLLFDRLWSEAKPVKSLDI